VRRHFILLIVGTCLLISNLKGQKVCGIDPTRVSHLTEFGIESEINHLVELQITKATQSNRNIRSRGLLKIPLVFHIIKSPTERYISDADIFDQIDILNKAFSGHYAMNSKSFPEVFRSLIGSGNIQFCIASSRESSIMGSSIIRVETNKQEIGLTSDLYNSILGGSDPWDPDYYLNIWIADTGSNITGFATYPWSNSEFDGVVIHPSFFGKNASARYNQGKVLVHELGHYLGLHHIWGSGMGCFDYDQVEDTPHQEKPYFGCPFFPQESCGSIDMHMNYMDYVDDACMNLFTSGQIKRMEVVTEEFRPYLGKSGVECVCDIKAERTVVFAPNPGTGQEIKIFFNGLEESFISDLKVYNSIGQLIKKERRLIYDRMVMNLSTPIKGVYYIEIAGSIYKYVVIN